MQFVNSNNANIALVVSYASQLAGSQPEGSRITLSPPRPPPQTGNVGNQSTEETSARHGERETSHHTSRISAEATGQPSLSSPAGPERQVRDPGAHSSPLGTNTTAPPPACHRIRPEGKRATERAACANTAADATPFRNLFRTFDAAVSHTGQ